MEYIPLVMVRENLDNIPRFLCPEGFHIRTYHSGEERLWAEVETQAGEFPNKDAALKRFVAEFGPHQSQMECRCLFIEDTAGRAIGTTTAWFHTFRGEDYGRIHWVGIIPEYQGKKLSKPLMSAAMNILAQHHTKAYLTTQTTSYKAINLYLHFGFVPYIVDRKERRGWLMMEETLNREIL